MALNYYGYHYHVGNDKKHSGITTDPQRRQSEHQQRWPGGRMIVVIGPVSEQQARAWEAMQTKTITPQR
jgi:predicted GIY-YIG superfamily endonuclease